MLQYVESYAEFFKFNIKTFNNMTHRFRKISNNAQIDLIYNENSKYVMFLTTSDKHEFKVGDLILSIINNIPLHQEEKQ